jgi:hypothetical protein
LVAVVHLPLLETTPFLSWSHLLEGVRVVIMLPVMVLPVAPVVVVLEA